MKTDKSNEQEEAQSDSAVRDCPDSAGSLPHVGKPENVERTENLLYRNQYGTWTSIMARVLMDTPLKMLGVERIEWLKTSEVDFLLANEKDVS